MALLSFSPQPPFPLPLLSLHSPILKSITNLKPYKHSIPTPTLSLSPISFSPKSNSQKTLTLSLASSSFTSPETSDFSFDLTGIGEEEDDDFLAGSPWEGALVYRRDASAAHVELCTTLERLGLGKLSSAVSKSRASAMGIRLPARMGREVGLGGDGTPVLLSIDVTRRKRRLKLDGIVRTVITLGCNRCAQPAAESVFSNFTLLLTEDPIEELDNEINMGVMYGEDKSKISTGVANAEEEDDEKEIDPDDKLYFPQEEREIDISKHIRDIVHVEITINAICDASCKGLCLKCGTNLNKKSCNCNREEVEDRKESGPLKNLRKQMQQK
ncbi:uncharacterized protein M6B38_271550 [Iris pallida]|uniref:Large ribosomal RNA subunit accumulation protein YCED homolog 1, chloroplastic n=1 Tax=Iris pallida TaxID=29817 RepID=A0AAX6I6Y8_IRIPA|nr:uncharacterized protein M6B38_343740 [Iris pallida]KAJ6848992.1 uncharacterized protein M6B38_271550 [Iris pallida]